MVLVLLSQSQNCLMSACTASYISESELSAVGWLFILTVINNTMESEFWAVGLDGVSLTISESELSDVGLYCKLHLRVGIVCCGLSFYITNTRSGFVGFRPYCRLSPTTSDYRVGIVSCGSGIYIIIGIKVALVLLTQSRNCLLMLYMLTRVKLFSELSAVGIYIRIGRVVNMKRHVKDSILPVV